MLELPEVLCLTKQLNDAVKGKKVAKVYPPTKPHKFCWFSMEPSLYNAQLTGSAVNGADGFGLYVELSFDNGKKLCINDGVNVRLTSDESALPKDYQLLIAFTDGAYLVFTVAMYGGIVLHSGDYDNDYYAKSRAYVSPFSPEFETLFYARLAESKPSLSAKAFVATEQRFPGIGNGVAQDVLFEAGILPKSKISALSEDGKRKLLSSIVSVLKEMTAKGGRDTETNLFGIKGSYQTKMSKLSLTFGCPKCGGAITKEAYLGGSVYYCTNCQK